MEIRGGSTDDADGVASVARASLVESYGHFVDEATIDRVVAEWYATDSLAELLAGEEVLFLVAEVDDAVVGFVQGAEIETDPLVGEIHWLHVDPSARQRGRGVQLLSRAQEAFADRGAKRLRGLVLAENDIGTTFYEDHGFERVDTAEARLGDRTAEEYVYEKGIGDGVGKAVLEPIEDSAGRELVVNVSDAERGVRAPFYPVFDTRELADRYGWFCGDCGTTDNAMDSMGRIVCNECGNERKPTRWDAAYL